MPKSRSRLRKISWGFPPARYERYSYIVLPHSPLAQPSRCIQFGGGQIRILLAPGGPLNSVLPISCFHGHKHKFLSVRSPRPEHQCKHILLKFLCVGKSYFSQRINKNTYRANDNQDNSKGMFGLCGVPCFLQLRGQARQEEKRQNQSSHRKNHKFNGGPKGGNQFVEKGSRNQYHSDHSHKNWYSSQDKRTTMTVSVTQEQMRQNVFHHTLTVPLSSVFPPVFSLTFAFLPCDSSNNLVELSYFR